MNVFLQLLLAAGIVLPMAYIAFVQWHRMKTIDAIQPTQKWILRTCADILANHKNSVDVRIAADRLWRFVLNSDFLILMGSRVSLDPNRDASVTCDKDRGILDGPVKAAALCTLAFHPIAGPHFSSLFAGETYNPEALDKMLLSLQPEKRLARKVESEERAVERVISTELPCLV